MTIEDSSGDTKKRFDSVGVILLAAGASARMGEPKQLLLFQGETLLRRAARAALAVSDKVVVALGANIEIARREIEDLPVEIVENVDWETGMGGSIKLGLGRLAAGANELSAAILMVCDQPFADENLLSKIVAKFQETDAPIVACQYQTTLGVPALFHRRLFPELLALDAPTGAKRLIKKYRARAAKIQFPAGAFDVDTPQDYENLMRNFS